MFGALSIAAAGFAAWPVWQAHGLLRPARALLAGALAASVLGVGIGFYLFVGMPQLAWRAVAPPEAGGVRGLVAELSRRVRDRPRDLTGWTLLGRGYLTLGDPEQAAVAFHQASDIAPEQQRPELLSAYGEALTLAADGTVTPEAEAAFDATLRAQPRDFGARFYLGQAFAARRDTARALSLWQSLLADSPPNAPWRAGLIDRIATLGAPAGSTPDLGAMVNRLASRLQSNPRDLEGWQRLIRAYVVMGEEAAARAALVTARAAMRGNSKDLAALAAEARVLKIGN